MKNTVARNIPGLVSAALVWMPMMAFAATFTVISTNDSGTGSLRQAIQDAVSGDSVRFFVTGVITLTSGQLLVTNNLSIVGPGATNLAVSGNTNDRVFGIASNVTISISGLTIRDGRTKGSTNFDTRDGLPGGGLYNAGTLTLGNCVITNNATSRGGDSNVGDAGDGGDGGGVYNIGTLELSTCTISSNSCGSGGMYYASGFPGGGGSGGKGGGIYSLGHLTLTACIVSGNSSGAGGGSSAPVANGGPAGAGGGIYNGGPAELRDCTVSGNTGAGGGFAGGSGGDGGGIYNTDTLRLNTCIISGNSAGPGLNGRSGNGGGIYNAGDLMLDACTLSGNSGGPGRDGGNGGKGGEGGGIYNANIVTLTACTFGGNSGGRGGLSSAGNFVGGDGGDGGGVYNEGALTLTNCTFNRNTGGLGGNGADSFGAAGRGGSGGNGGAIYNTNRLTLTAGTFSGNSGGWGGTGGFGFFGGAGGNGGSGGGVFNTTNASSATLRNVLVGLNSVGAGGPSGGFVSGGASGPPGSYGVGPDLAGSFTSQGHNLIGQMDSGTGFTNGVNGDLVGSGNVPLDAKLGPLQDNGGPIFTMGLLAGSPAIDQGHSGGLTTDQRGRTRPIDKGAVTNAGDGDASDIGAYEMQLDEFWLTRPMKSGSDYVTGFASEIGLRYRIERKDDLAPGIWTVVGDNVPGTGGIVEVTDSGAASQIQRFYRAITIP